MSIALLTLSLLLAPAQTEPQAAPPASTDAASATDDIEFVGDENGTQSDGSAALPEDDEPKDTTPPSIDDIAIAVMNPDAAPIATALLSDDSSGVEKATLFVRKREERRFTEVALKHTNGGMFIAQIPGGLQKTGFFYYVEVYDAAGNGPAQVGSEEKPLWVDPAVTPTIQRIADPDPGDGYRIHPGLVAGVLIAGVAATIASSWFWYDYAVVIPQKKAVIDGDSGISEADRNEFLAQVQTKALGDIAIGSVLTTVGLATTATGVGLAFFALDE